MSYADKVFIEMCRDIIDNGTSTEGEKVRPVWEDGTPAYTIKKFGVVNRYNLAKEFPALTLRRTGIKSCTDEMLWIWQKKSNNIHELNSHIWDSWADEDGSIGKAYPSWHPIQGRISSTLPANALLHHSASARRGLASMTISQSPSRSACSAMSG